jgi:hypothetical protein
MALVTTIHLRGDRASQPAASSANSGYIYCVTDEGNIIERSNGSAWQAYSPTSSGGDYLKYEDQKAQNTSGGTFTSGSWQTRVINTEVSDVGGHGTLASNQITLAAGTYIIRASAPAFATNRHQARLQNVTDATTVLVGTSEHTDTQGDGNQSRSWVQGRFTIGASKALEIQHQCQGTRPTFGFGVESNFTTEVYTVVELWKVG